MRPLLPITGSKAYAIPTVINAFAIFVVMVAAVAVVSLSVSVSVW